MSFPCSFSLLCPPFLPSFVCRSEPKTVAPAFLAHLSREWKRPEIDLQLKCDVPNQIMNAWQGDLTVEGKRENVNLGNFLLTDSVLRNTGWAVGMIVYTVSTDGGGTRQMKATTMDR